MSSIKLPKQLYVTFKDQGIDPVNGPNPPFGFLHAYEPGKAAFEKKKKTQDDWAYNLNYSYNVVIEKRGHDYYIVGERWRHNNGMPATLESFEELIKTPPMVWDNTPMRGFRVLKSVSRWSTSNKLWRILDPRRVEFEITTAVMEQLIEDATIYKGGEIDATCAWMTNKNLVVVS